MKRGAEINGSAAVTAGLCRSVCPTASVAARGGSGRDQAVGLGNRRGDRLLDQHRDAGLQQRQATRTWSRVGTATTTPSTGGSILAHGRQRDRTHVGGDRPRPLQVDIDHRDEIDPRGRAQNAGVVATQMTDADHRRTEGRLPHVGGAPAPTDPAHHRHAGAVRGLEHAVPVQHHRTTRIDRQHGGAGRAKRLNRRNANHRHVETHVLVRLRDLDGRRTRVRPTVRHGR